MAKPDNTQFYNPVKFSVYRNAAASTGSAAFALLAFDTKLFDTGNNVSGGVFTAPFAGFYHFNWYVGVVTASGDLVVASIFKNGARTMDGVLAHVTSTDAGAGGSGIIQLAANDTIDVRVYDNTAARTIDTGQNANSFSGFLVSTT